VHEENSKQNIVAPIKGVQGCAQVLNNSMICAIL